VRWKKGEGREGNVATGKSMARRRRGGEAGKEKAREKEKAARGKTPREALDARA